MALDFGDAGLFDPIPPTSSNKKVKDDDENENSKDWKDEGSDEEKREEEEEDEFEDWPTAPPLDILDCIKGYEMVSFDATSVPPPPFEEVDEGPAVKGEGKEGEGEDHPDHGDGGGGDTNNGEIKAKVIQNVCVSLLPTSHLRVERSVVHLCLDTVDKFTRTLVVKICPTLINCIAKFRPYL